MGKAKAELNFRALFFPETIQAQLEGEQKLLRCLFAEISPRLFSFFPPCIPFAGKVKAASEASLFAGPIKAQKGWLYRPAALLPETAGRIPPAATLCMGEEGGKLLASSSGRLKPPGEPALILGFAGDLAEALLEKAHASQATGSRLSAALRAAVWYCAEVSALAGSDAGESALFSFWSEGKPLWKRRGVAFEAGS